MRAQSWEMMIPYFILPAATVERNGTTPGTKTFVGNAEKVLMDNPRPTIFTL